MTESDFEFLLLDRIQKIRQVVSQYGEENMYIAYSGGADSVTMSHLIDEALPDNKIPRVYSNTGIEFKAVVDFVKEQQATDPRITILTPKKNVPETLKAVGYPFKSKQHSHYVDIYQRGNREGERFKLYVSRGGTYDCPKKLRYQFTDDFTLPVSSKCCSEFKKRPMLEYERERERERPISIIGIRQSEGGKRATSTNCLLFKHNKLRHFYPMLVVPDEWMEWYRENRGIKLCKLYYPPYNFKRTGCKGCPYNIHIQQELDTLEKLLPNEYKQCEIIWKPVYDEYRRIGYRLRKWDQLQF